MLVLWCFPRIDPDRGSHAWVDYGRDQIVDYGSVVPVVSDLAIVSLGAGQLLRVEGCLRGQVHLDFVQALEGGQRHAPGEEGADGWRSVYKSVVDRRRHELVIFYIQDISVLVCW